MRETLLSGIGVAILTLTAAEARAQGSVLPDSLPPGVTPEMVERGKAVFEGPGMCSSCHGAHADGALGPNLTDSEWWHAKGSYVEILRLVLVGVPEEESTSGVAMPPRGGSIIGDEAVQSVAAWVWTLSHPETGDSLPLGVTPVMVETGRRVFHGEGGCTKCHGPDARGGIGPDLTDSDWLHAKGSYVSIVTQILVGVPADKSRSGVPMLPRGGTNISDADVHAVAAYIWALSHRR